MRNFSEYEKEIITDLVENETYLHEGLLQLSIFLENYYIGDSHGMSIMVNAPQKSAYISVPESEKKKLRTHFINVITILNLLKDLQSEGKIILLGNSLSGSNGSFVIGKQYENGTTFELPDPVKMFAIESFKKYILVTEDLKQLTLSNFMSPEQIRHHQTMNISVIGIVVAIVLGLIGVF